MVVLVRAKAREASPWRNRSFVLILLASPIGNSALERSFKLVKETSLDPLRQSADPETKSLMNKARVNADCRFSSLQPAQTLI